MRIEILLSAATLILLAILRWSNVFNARQRADATFIALIASALILVLLPLDRLTGVKFSFLELEIGKPVSAAVDPLNLNHHDIKRLRKRLSSYDEQILALRGSRILWIDDHPEKRLGARRLLRKLGVNLILARSSCSALKSVRLDMDFDIIVTDLTRADELLPVEFLEELRDTGLEPLRSMPFIIFTQHQDDNVEKIVGEKAVKLSPMKVSKGTVEVIDDVANELIESSMDPVRFSEQPKEVSGSLTKLKALCDKNAADVKELKGSS